MQWFVHEFSHSTTEKQNGTKMKILLFLSNLCEFTVHEIKMSEYMAKIEYWYSIILQVSLFISNNLFDWNEFLGVKCQNYWQVMVFVDNRWQ